MHTTSLMHEALDAGWNYLSILPSKNDGMSKNPNTTNFCHHVLHAARSACYEYQLVTVDPFAKGTG